MRIYAQAAAALAALLVVAPLTGGCGSGSSGNKNSSGSSSRAKGAITVTIKWPQQPSRVIPLAAGSVVIALQRTVPGPTVGPNPTIPPLTPPAEGTTPRQTTYTINNLELGTYHITATAFPNADGTGTSQAAAAVDQEVVGGQNNPLPLTMNATVDKIELSPATGDSLRTGQTRQFTATAKDVDGNVVIVSSKALTWGSQPSTVATIDQNGLATVVGIGQATVKVTYAEPGTPVGQQGTGASATAIVNAVEVGLADGPWPKFHGNAQNTGLATMGGATTGNKQWQFTTDGSVVFSSPAVTANGTVYVGAYDNNLYCLNPDGSLKWKFATGDVIDSSPALGKEGSVYVGSYDGKVYSVNAETGAKNWERALGGPVVASPAIGPDGLLYVGGGAPDNKLYALDPLNGTIFWQLATGGGVQTCASFSLDGKTLYVGSQDNSLYALDVTDPGNVNKSRLKWKFATGDQIFSSSPAVGQDGKIYFGSLDGKLYALTPSGDPVGGWPFDTGGAQIFSSPAIGADGTVYFGSADSSTGLAINRVFAVNPNGTKKWDFQAGDLITSSPAIGIDGVIYIGCYDGNVYALNPDGTKKWAFFVGDNIDSSPAIGANGAIYVGAYNSRVYAIQ